MSWSTILSIERRCLIESCLHGGPGVLSLSFHAGCLISIEYRSLPENSSKSSYGRTNDPD